jgi:hypothetical protein
MHGTNKCRKIILMTIRHGYIAKEVIYCYKCSVFLIFSRHQNFMETGISI